MYFYTGKTGYINSRKHKEIQFALLFLNSRNLLKENLTLVFLALNRFKQKRNYSMNIKYVVRELLSS